MKIGRMHGLVLSLLGTLAGGCAARQGGGLADRLVNPGEPPVSFDVPARSPQSTAPASTVSEALQEEIRARPSPSTPASHTIEFADRRLAEALQAAAQMPTAVNYCRVAAEYRRLHVLDKAYDYLTMAIRTAPKSPEAFEERAQVWRDWGLASIGLGDAYRALHFAPTSASVHNTLGTLLQAIGDAQEARKAYRQALALDSSAAYALSNLCYLSFLEGHPADAAAECRAALDIEPRLSAALNNLALAYAAQGDIPAAREEFFRAGDVATGSFNLGLVYMAMKQYRLAEESFRAAIDASPSLPAAREQAERAAKLVDRSGQTHGQRALR